jgi:hypothetical protein
VSLSKPESETDKLASAEAVLNFFTVNDGQWKTIPCRTCGLHFVYRHPYDGIKCCSVECYKEEFRKLGLEWDPDREPSRRWGRFVPAVIAPDILYKIRQVLAEIPEDQPQNIVPELLA